MFKTLEIHHKHQKHNYETRRELFHTTVETKAHIESLNFRSLAVFQTEQIMTFMHTSAVEVKP